MTRPLPLKDWGNIAAFPGLSVRYLKENRCVPLHREDGEILVAMADPADAEVSQALELALGAPVQPVPAGLAPQPHPTWAEEAAPIRQRSVR